MASAVAQELLWFSGGKPTPLAWQAVDILKDADQDGLQPQDYSAQALADSLRQIQQNGADALTLQQTDARLTAAMERFLQDLATGRVDPRKIHQNFDAAYLRVFDARMALLAALQSRDLQGAVDIARPNFPLYPILKKWLAHYRTLENDPAWSVALPEPAGKKLEPGQSYPGMNVLRTRLVRLGDAETALEFSTAGDTYDPDTVKAVKAFQLRHGLTDDGIIGQQTLQALNVKPAARVRQIELSMERIRWTPLQHGKKILVVNIPGYTLYGYETQPDHSIDLQVEMKVVIGRALNHRTPLMDEMMEYVEFSPYWNVTPSIARKETIPAIRRDPGYFSRQQLEFVDAAGNVHREVTEANLEAVMKGQMRIRQRPGPHNSLGGVKFAFPNNQNIYMHHTPATELFSRSRRDFSHGCIRVEDPVGLASFVLGNNSGWTPERIKQAMGAGKSSFVRLSEPIPVVIAYSTVMAKTDGNISFYPDVYGHDRLLEQALSRR